MKKNAHLLAIAAMLTASLALTLAACGDKDAPEETTPLAEQTTVEAPVTDPNESDTAISDNESDTTSAEETEPVTQPEAEIPEFVPEADPIDPATFGDAAIVYDCDDGSILSTYNEKTAADFEGVAAHYVAAGYSLYSYTDMGGNLAATYVKGDAMAHVYWHPHNSELNLVLSDTAGATLPKKPTVTEGTYKCTVTQIKDIQNFIGMGYVIQLTDGSYIVYDGSFSNQASTLIGYLTRNYDGEGLPTVRAWVLTHSHNDHYPAFEMIANKESYRKKLKVENVIVSPLNDANFSLNAEEEFYLSTKLYDDAALLGANVIFAHTGMEFRFGNLNMEILYTPESVYKYTNDKGNFNSTSLITRLYADGYSALFTGDVSNTGVAFAMSAYGESNYLKSDMCQVSHHGVEGSYILELYDEVQAPIMWYPASYSLYDSMDSIYSPQVHIALETRSYVKEILIHGVGQFTRAWGTTFDASTPLTVPDYEPTNRHNIGDEFVMPEGADYLATDKTTYASGEPIMVTAYGSGTDWVGILREGDTDVLRWWYLAPVDDALMATSGYPFDANRLQANGSDTALLPPGAYTVVLLDGGKTITDGEFIMTVAITVTDEIYEVAEPSESPIIHVTFDGSATDVADRATVNEKGTVSYVDGYLGQGAVVGNGGYVTIPDYTPGAGSFTIALWANVSAVDGDPALFATKNWSNGGTPGFALGITSSNLHANIGSGQGHRIDLKPSLPSGSMGTWVHYTFVVDRDARQMKVSINFGQFQTVDIPAVLVNAPYEGLGVLAIGQDATGTYGSSMTCIVDELMIFDRALTQDELTTLAQSYAN